MKKEINPYAIIVALFLIIIGAGAVLIDVFITNTSANVFVSIGCSLIASGIVLLSTALLIDFRRGYIVWDEWKLSKIYKTRAEKNLDSDPKLEKHNIKQLDGIAFGLKSFRSNRRNDVLTCMQRGMNVRFLVMSPYGECVRRREVEENVVPGSISKSIEDLCIWADDLNKQSNRGKIAIKFYDTMTLDFYWRIDDEIYIGPYMLNTESQQTITYQFIKGGKGFSLYTDYFETLWSDTRFCCDSYKKESPPEKR